MNAQEHEDRAAVRIKFASLKSDDTLQGDSGSEYATLFAALPKAWAVDAAGTVNTRHRPNNQAWRLHREDDEAQDEVYAVAHETGLEILVAIASDVAKHVIVDLLTWVWRRWGQARLAGISTGHKVESSLVIEETSDHFPDGTSRTTRRVIRGPISDLEVLKALQST